MSDPVTNAEVEDVLSSIRRLVSEDKRPLQSLRKIPVSDRLVLTPALRVADEPAVSDPEDAPRAEAPRPPAPSIESLITDDSPIDVYGDGQGQAALARQPEEDYSDDPYGFDEGDDLLEEDDDAHLQKTVTEDLEEDDWSDDLELSSEGADEAEEEEDDLSDALQARIRTVTSDDPAEEEDEDLSDPEEVEEIEEPVRVAEAAKVVEEPEPAPAVAERPLDKSAVLSSKIAALETAIGQIAGTWEPDDPGESDYAGTEAEAMDWEDDEPLAEEEAVTTAAVRPQPVSPPAAPEPKTARATVTPEPAPEPQPVWQAPEAAGLDLADDTQFIDEEALRDLVAEIVRSELQGALGERITRNVRKLVRREIHRALTAQELE